ncbi:HEAT repeat domain-containing protein [Candidatus Sumerlaeota bacterium]|nr:HEAT repeat domain-containing protein [Candidatus Sumerlaeota bacterium]
MNPVKRFACSGIIFLLAFFILTRQIFCQERESARILQIAGVSTAPEKILEFLQKGSPAAINIKAVNEKSLPATQLAISSIEELTRLKYKPAMPILIRTAKGDFTTGQKSLVNYDCESVSPSLREEKKNQLFGFLRFNGINALGLIGTPEALPALQEIFRDAPPSLYKINAALGMACLDYGEGIDYLVTQVQKKDRFLAQESATALSFITGMELDYEPYTPVSRREKTVKSIKKWWKENQSSFRPDGKEILERRLTVKTMPPFSMRSIRDLVKAAADYGDIDNRMKSMDAREKLTEMGGAILPELKAMCLDQEEDLNIRIEAIRRYARLASWNEAKDVLKKGSKDKNPEIRGICRDLLKNPPMRPN